MRGRTFKFDFIVALVGGVLFGAGIVSVATGIIIHSWALTIGAFASVIAGVAFLCLSIGRT